MPSSESAWPDLAGRIVGEGAERHHVLPVRVYFEDTDFSGLVYHASYVRWFERGRSDFLRLLGNSHHALLAGEGPSEPSAFVVRRLTVDYLKPARIDDVLEVETRVKDLGSASVLLDQRIAREGRVISEALVTVVLVSLAGKPLRIAGAVRDALSGK